MGASRVNRPGRGPAYQAPAKTSSTEPQLAPAQRLSWERRQLSIVVPPVALEVHFPSRVISLDRLFPEDELCKLCNCRGTRGKEEAELQQFVVDGNDFIGEEVTKAPFMLPTPHEIVAYAADSPKVEGVEQILLVIEEYADLYERSR
jgi:hypothetical protein